VASLEESAGAVSAESTAFASEVKTRLVQPGGLTSAEVARRAVLTSPTVRARQHDVQAERASEDEANVGWWPRLNLIARYTRFSPYDQPSLGPFVVAPTVGEGPVPAGTPLVSASNTFPAFINNYYLQAQLVLPLTDYVFKVSEQTASARASRRAAELRAQAAKVRDASDARLLYYAWARSSLQELVAEKTVDNSRTQHRAARDRLELGRGTRADELSAKARLVAAERLREQARLTTARLEADLRIVIHAGSQEPLRLGEDLTVRAPSPRATASAATLCTEAEGRRLELLAYHATDQALSHQERVVAAAGVPRVDLFANGYYANPNLRFLPPTDEWRATWDVGVQLTWTPNDWATSSERSNRTAAERSRTQAERDSLRDALCREVNEAQRAALDAQAGLASIAARLEASEEAYRVRRETYSLGKGTLVELMNAETDLMLARLEWVEAHVAEHEARARLRHAVGWDVAPDGTPPR
jgi:outer membrane protein TolC